VTREYRNIDLLLSDKVRIKDRGSNVAANITLNRDSIISDNQPLTVTRAGATEQRREFELIAIDPDQDYTAVPSLAKIPRDPMVISAAVGKETVTIPLVIDAATRQALATFAQNYEENARRKVAFKVPVAGYALEPGDLFALADIADGFDNEIFKCTQTSHGANWVVDVEGEAILRCRIFRNEPGNALFVSGDLFCDIRYCDVDGINPQDWHGLSFADGLAFGTTGNVVSSSYAKPGGVPTFLMGGNDYTFVEFSNAPIMLSHDGVTWTTVYTTYPGAIYDIVWDSEAGAFYAEWHHSSAHKCLRSETGHVWTEVVDDFWSHTVDGITPDGHVGFDPDTGVTIRPEDLAIDFMDTVRCTAFADGIWMAGGHSGGGSATATSLDGGATWSLATSGSVGSAHNAEIYTMVAAPQSDIG
jgi:hypothetical protein